MAKGTHVKIDRTPQDGYNIALTPETNAVKRVHIWLGQKDREDNDDPIYRWDTSIGPIEVQPNSSSQPLFTIDSDQLPVSASECFYQLACEIESLVDEEAEEDGKIVKTGKKIIELETLLTEPRSLSEASTIESVKQNAAQTTMEGLQPV